jgi:ketosteroid isomerase-like protein
MVTPSFAQDSRKQQLEAFFDNLGEAAETGNKDAYLGLFLPSAAMFLPHRPPLLGREKIGDFFDDFLMVVLVLDSYEQEQVDIVGDIAMVRSRGIGHYLVKATGEKIPFDQKYLDVLRYDGGNWYMTYHVANSSTFESGLWDRDWEGN